MIIFLSFFLKYGVFAYLCRLKVLEEKHYVMAVLVRGGVFGDSGKE